MCFIYPIAWVLAIYPFFWMYKLNWETATNQSHRARTPIWLSPNAIPLPQSQGWGPGGFFLSEGLSGVEGLGGVCLMAETKKDDLPVSLTPWRTFYG